MKEQKRVYLAFWSNWLPIWDLLFFNDDENLEEKGLIKKLPKEFFAEFKSIEEPKKGVKRMEPGAQTNGKEEKATLKKINKKYFFICEKK